MGNWDPQEVQQPFRPSPNGVRDCTTTLRQLLIGAEFHQDSIFPLISNSVADLAGTVFLSPVLSGYNGSPDTRFSQGMTRLMSWLDGERYLRPPQPLVVSLLLSLVSTLLFSRIRGILSHLKSLTHRFPQFPWRNLCSLVMLAVSSLVYTATDTAFF